MHRVRWICQFNGFDSLVIMTLRFDQPSLRSGRGNDHQGGLIGPTQGSSHLKGLVFERGESDWWWIRVRWFRASSTCCKVVSSGVDSSGVVLERGGVRDSGAGRLDFE